MRRFTITPERRHGDRVTFDHDESHHLARVLRLKAGDTVVAVDGTGRDYTVRLDAGRGATRLARWQRVGREAAKQCGRTRLPEIEAARPLSTLIEAPAAAACLRLCFWEDERAPLADVIASLASRPSAAIVIVGPEGGLTADEAGAARAAGWRVVGFGPRVLRTETAGPAIVAALQFEFGDLG